MKKFVLLSLLLLSFDIRGADIKFKEIYLDGKKNAHLVAANGAHLQVTQDGNATRVGLSKDKATAAWLTEQDWLAEDDDQPGASKLTVYRNHEKHDIECLPFIREYWFWEDGKKIGIFCGGLHFAGTYSLYDSTTGLRIESFHQTDIAEEKRPMWSLPGDRYHPENIY